MLLAARSPLAPSCEVGSGRGEKWWPVLGAFPTALYAGHPEHGVLAVVTSDGLALPTAWRLPVSSAQVAWGVGAGDRIRVEAGEICLPHNTIHSVRRWRPARVQRLAGAVIGGSGVVAGASGGVRDDVVRHEWFVDRLGRGPGLTPEGDDEICGVLLVAYAVGDQRPGDVTRPLLHRTTALSASLIAAAIDGYAVPELVTYSDAALRGRPTNGLRADVARIGHTSGAALLRGVDHAIANLTTASLTKERISA